MNAWVESLGWTLVHFFWQGILIAALYAVARWIARSSGPNTRYVLGCVALAALMLAPLVTLWVTRPAGPSSRAMAVTGDVAPENISILGAYALPASVDTGMWPAQIMPWVVAIWLTGAVALWVRLVGGWMTAARMRSTFVRPAPPEWQQILSRLAIRIGLSRPVRLLVSGLVEVPSVVGWLRPVVLVPIGALAGLPAEQVEALLIHELAHIRRHDYVVHIVQSIAEALLFYHPAVWWVSGHIRTTRELCCDDVAVSVSGDVLTYARALAELESARPSHLHAVLAANSGSLSYRIGRLLGQSRPLSRTLSGPGVIASAILLAVAVWSMFGQTPVAPPQPALGAPPPPPSGELPPPRFEVASIKLNTEARPGFGVRALPGGRLTADKERVRFLIQYAYRLKPFQIAGGPGWIDSDQYDIEAKAEGDAGAAQMRLMLQKLLEERFKLKVHIEKKELPVYTLTAARGGLKLPPPKEGACVTPADTSPGPPLPGQIPCGRPMVAITPSGSRMQGGKVSMSALADVLSNILGRDVLDKTGFTGTFDLNLEFSLDQPLSAVPTAQPGPQGTSIFSMGPDQRDAIAQQIISHLSDLGLKVDAAKAPVDVLVIDHIERPSGN